MDNVVVRHVTTSAIPRFPFMSSITWPFSLFGVVVADCKMSHLKTTTWPFALLGVILSVYALYVEYKISHKKPEDEEFSALCDIESIGASCRYVERCCRIIVVVHNLIQSSLFLSIFLPSYITHLLCTISSAFALPEGKLVSYFGIVPEGHLLDVPNAFIGLVYYTYWLLLRPLFPAPLTAMVSTLAMMASLFLAYKLLILQELCLLCWSTHLINFRLLLRAYTKLGEGSLSNEPAIKEPPKIKRI